jgi:hypothetical protein
MLFYYLESRQLQYLLRLLVVAIASVTFTWPAMAAKEADTVRDGWTMQQTSQLMGEVLVVESAQGVKVTAYKKGLSMLCLAPFKEVVYSNAQRPANRHRCLLGHQPAIPSGRQSAAIPLP